MTRIAFGGVGENERPKAVEADGRPQTAAHRLTARRWADELRPAYQSEVEWTTTINEAAFRKSTSTF
jgi:hypothetical protein